MFQFGVGRLFVNPVGGNLAVNPTPYSILTVQNVSVDLNQDLKELVGQNKIADDIAPAQIKITGKFEYGNIDIRMWNQIFFADNQVTGMKNILADEPWTIPTSSPSNPTVTVTNSAVFYQDLGVRYSATGISMIRVSSSPTTGQYAVSNGVYTFSPTEGNVGVLISYVFTTNQSNTYTVQFANHLMGYGPLFELWLSEPYQLVNGLNNGLHLFQCRISKFNNDLKNTDYLKPTMDFSAYANAAGQIGEFFEIFNQPN